MITPYDQGIHESFKAACKGYFRGSATADAAWQKFRYAVDAVSYAAECFCGPLSEYYPRRGGKQ